MKLRTLFDRLRQRRAPHVAPPHPANPQPQLESAASARRASASTTPVHGLPRILAPVEEPAVPLTPAAATALVEYLQRIDAIQRAESPFLARSITGYGHLAEVVFGDGGVAAISGHDTVPFLASNLYMLGRAVADAEQLGARFPESAAFRTLHGHITALARAARVVECIAVLLPPQEMGGWIPNCTWKQHCPPSGMPTVGHPAAGTDKERA